MAEYEMHTHFAQVGSDDAEEHSCDTRLGHSCQFLTEASQEHSRQEALSDCWHHSSYVSAIADSLGPVAKSRHGASEFCTLSCITAPDRTSQPCVATSE